MHAWQAEFARALLDADAPPPEGLAHESDGLPRRFAVYRNNVSVGLIEALEARFPAVRKIVGEEFFKAAARVFARAHPPRAPIMSLYGEAFPSFLEAFEPARELPYLSDVARLEMARTRAYHAPDAESLPPAALAACTADQLETLRFVLHPSLEILGSAYPIVTIWAMNCGEMALAPITDWQGEDALIIRPGLDVEVRRLAPGGKSFLQSLAAGVPLGEAAARARMADGGFDLAANLAELFSGLAAAMKSEE